MWEVQCYNVLMERQSGNGREEGDTGEGERDSDVEPATQTESQFRENHFAGVEEGWRDYGRRWRRHFSCRAHPFHSVFPQDTSSLPRQEIILPSAIIYVANSSRLQTWRP